MTLVDAYNKLRTTISSRYLCDMCETEDSAYEVKMTYVRSNISNITLIIEDRLDKLYTSAYVGFEECQYKRHSKLLHEICISYNLMVKVYEHIGSGQYMDFDMFLDEVTLDFFEYSVDYGIDTHAYMRMIKSMFEDIIINIEVETLGLYSRVLTRVYGNDLDWGIGTIIHMMSTGRVICRTRNTSSSLIDVCIIELM